MFCHDIVNNAGQKLCFDFLTNLEDDIDLADRTAESSLSAYSINDKSGKPKTQPLNDLCLLAELATQRTAEHNTKELVPSIWQEPQTTIFNFSQPESVMSATTTGLQPQQMPKEVHHFPSSPENIQENQIKHATSITYFVSNNQDKETVVSYPLEIDHFQGGTSTAYQSSHNEQLKNTTVLSNPPTKTQFNTEMQASLSCQPQQIAFSVSHLKQQQSHQQQMPESEQLAALDHHHQNQLLVSHYNNIVPRPENLVNDMSNNLHVPLLGDADEAKRKRFSFKKPGSLINTPSDVKSFQHKASVMQQVQHQVAEKIPQTNISDMCSLKHQCENEPASKMPIQKVLSALTNQVQKQQTNIGHPTDLPFSIGNLDTVSITKNPKPDDAQTASSSEMSCVTASFSANAGTVLPNLFTGESKPAKNTLEPVHQVENKKNSRNCAEKEVDLDSEISCSEVSEEIEMEISETTCMTTESDDQFLNESIATTSSCDSQEFFSAQESISEYFSEENSSSESEFSNKQEDGNALGKNIVFSENFKMAKDDIARALFNASEFDQKVMKIGLYKPSTSGVYIIDSHKLSNINDIKSDFLGQFRNLSSLQVRYDFKMIRVKDDEPYEFLLKTCYYKQASNCGVKRRIHRLINKDGNYSKFVGVVYDFGSTKFSEPQPHGNSKGSKPYYRSKLSSRKDAVKRLKTSDPKYVFDEMHTDACDTTEVPRNMHMIYNAKKKLRDRSLGVIGGDHDIIEKLILKSKIPDSGVLYVLLVPHLAIVLGYKWHLELLKLVADSSHNMKEVVGIDVTYNCTEYNITPLVFRHPALINCNGKKPYMIGPVLISNSQCQAAFKTFAQALTLHGLPEESDLILGSDGQMAMYNGFAEVFKNTTLILCAKHMKDGIKRQLSEYDAKAKKTIFKDIFEGTNCLINEDVNTINDAVIELKKTWDSIAPGFHNWFLKYQMPKFQKGMTRDRRAAAGLKGDELYYTNPTESIHNLLKKGMKRSTPLVDFVSHFDKETNLMARNVCRSALQQGPYVIALRYRNKFIVKKGQLRYTGKQRNGQTNQSHSTVKVEKIALVGNKKTKSCKPGEKMRMRLNRNICSSLLHKHPNYAYLIKTCKLANNNTLCFRCQKPIIKESQQSITGILNKKLPRKENENEGKTIQLLCHLKCMESSEEFSTRRIYICPEIHKDITPEQFALIDTLYIEY